MADRFSFLVHALFTDARRTGALGLVAALLLLGSGGLLVVAGCDTSESEGNESGTAFVDGVVASQATGTPIAKALVRVSPGGQTTETDSLGRYSLEVDVDSTTEVSVTASKDGYDSVTQSALLRADDTATPDFRLPAADGGGTTPPEEDPGRPNNILLQEQSRESIGVKESGAPETARITFQVTDSTGRAIDLDESTAVQFAFGQAPSGATIAPQSAPTNDNGTVTVNVSSGTTAGVVQVVATAEREDGETIRSKPVSVSIHGGLPDQDHFTVGPDRFNFQGLVNAGLTNTINIIVGDRYGNPVVDGTSVYFTTDSGVIEGSAQTDASGQASVTLTSSKPYPDDGVAVVTATTADDEQAAVSDQVPVLFSASGRIKVVSIPGQTFDDDPLNLSDDDDVETLLGALGSDIPFGTYEFIVEDRNGNPLPSGTTISFAADGTEVGAAGTVSATLGDTDFADRNGDGDDLDYEDIERGRGITEFSGAAVSANDPETVEQPDVETVRFRFDAPQSSRTYTFGENDDGGNSSAAAAQGRAAASSIVLRRDGKPVARRLSGGRIVRE
jgi:hypothetical protein